MEAQAFSDMEGAFTWQQMSVTIMSTGNHGAVAISAKFGIVCCSQYVVLGVMMLFFFSCGFWCFGLWPVMRLMLVGHNTHVLQTEYKNTPEYDIEIRL